ncbi:pyridoxal phosphate-dependent decarboxylase family protein [Niabella drilacis]|uniref:Glutamate or tyrosine decarboxylase n=1 Tax=Niabella drilacis (strain DSM 25811 / CCM 8410 / CCUG 62505 / LMG 26954 / E90) TaxID=1285928 RepID=A0A1G6S161_NIADE|nr:pyridoxal-dependent decarboxylase [Niabella drilacis]SDD10401.1 Glutamate or tyrosine decarboxylase [Niabella drilacis]
MNGQLQEDLSSLEKIFQLISRQGSDYLKNIGERPASTIIEPAAPAHMPYEGIGTIETLRKFNDRWEPAMVAASGPRYWGFVTGGTTPASIAGDWLTTIYDQNTQSAKGDGDISAAIELETVGLLRELLELPDAFLGGFVTGATMSNFTCLAVARQWLGQQLGNDIAKEGITQKMNILTATPHSSSIKSLALLGMGSSNILQVKTMEGNREAIDLHDLEAQIRQLNGAPFILISSAGTVNTVDFDDFSAIAALRKQYHFWWHIDAAFGGFAILSDTHKQLLKDWEQADSITVDCHKWLNVPYENAVFFVKEQHRMLQVTTFQNSNAPYLGDPLEHFNYLNLLPENSRRLKALPVWFTLHAYGRRGYRHIVENNIRQAQNFGAFIRSRPELSLLAPVRLNTVCFSFSAPSDDAKKVTSFLAALNKTGKIFMSPTHYKGQPGIRAAFVNFRTTEKDVELVQELMGSLL